jgi:hypothetical protein
MKFYLVYRKLFEPHRLYKVAKRSQHVIVKGSHTICQESSLLPFVERPRYVKAGVSCWKIYGASCV